MRKDFVGISGRTFNFFNQMRFLKEYLRSLENLDYNFIKQPFSNSPNPKSIQLRLHPKVCHTL